ASRGSALDEVIRRLDPLVRSDARLHPMPRSSSREKKPDNGFIKAIGGLIRRAGPSSQKQTTSKIFISYRRDDSMYQARLIAEELRKVLPAESIFFDIHSIPPGVDFTVVLKEHVRKSDTLLALIGPRWIDAADPMTGQRRLDNPDDFVRFEIAE